MHIHLVELEAMQTVSSLQNGSTTPSFNSQEGAKAVSLKRRRPEGEVQLESGRVDSQHEAAEASEVLQNMDDLDLDPIIMAMRYVGVPEELWVQEPPATWLMIIQRCFLQASRIHHPDRPTGSNQAQHLLTERVGLLREKARQWIEVHEKLGSFPSPHGTQFRCHCQSCLTLQLKRLECKFCLEVDKKGGHSCGLGRYSSTNMRFDPSTMGMYFELVAHGVQEHMEDREHAARLEVKSLQAMSSQPERSGMQRKERKMGIAWAQPLSREIATHKVGFVCYKFSA